jgi:uncharacterized protein YggU (UPF0235/DUF167 family)
MSFFEPYKGGSLIKIKLTPNATKNAFGAEVFIDANGAEYLKASVTTAPEKGKANKELLKMLAKSLELAISKFELISGQTDHFKKIFINQALNEELAQKIYSLKKEK